MPLPENSTFSLQGHHRPGDLNPTQSAKPKQAMVVRVTAEVLEALQAFPAKLEVSFGEKPTLHIGEHDYPMKPVKENCPHDVYLRSYTAAKPMAPLRLHANVTGKFMVQASLDKAVEHIQSNNKRAEAAKGRGVVSIDAPPPTTAATQPARRKKTQSNMFRKPHAQPQPDYIKVPDSSSLPSSSQLPTSKPPPSPSKPIDPSLKLRLLKCLAKMPRSTDDVLRFLSDGDRTSVLHLLKETGEQTKDKLWTLSNQSWTLVRPYDWDKCTEAERVSMARQGRLALTALKIPESDPTWGYFRPRPSAPVLTPNVSQTPPTRPVTSGKKNIITKPEATAATSKEAKSSAPRRPGSGFQLKRAVPTDTPSPLGSQPPTPTTESSSSKVPAPHPTVSRKTIPIPPKRTTPPLPHTKNSSISSTKGKDDLPPRPSTKPSKREDEEEEEGEVGSDEDDRKVKRSRSGSRTREQETKRARPRSPDRERSIKRPRSRSPAGSIDERRGRESKERARREVDAKSQIKREGERKDKIRRGTDERKPIPQNSTRDPDYRKDPTALKRKPAKEDNGEAPVHKKRKTEDGAVPSRDLTLPKKPEPPSSRPQQRPAPIPKIKKDPSVPRSSVPPNAVTTSSRASSTTDPLQKPGKGRPTHYYTSSSDEGEIKPNVTKKPSVPKIPRHTPIKREESSSSSLSPPSVTSPAKQRIPPRPPLPTDRKALRARYAHTHTDYLMAYAKMSNQRSLLSGLQDGSGDEIDVGDEILDPEELEKIRQQHDVLRGELEAIQDALGVNARS